MLAAKGDRERARAMILKARGGYEQMGLGQIAKKADEDLARL